MDPPQSGQIRLWSLIGESSDQGGIAVMEDGVATGSFYTFVEVDGNYLLMDGVMGMSSHVAITYGSPMTYSGWGYDTLEV